MPPLEDLIKDIESLVTSPGYRMPDSADLPTTIQAPRYATIRELDIKVSGNTIKAKYKRAKYSVDLADYGGLQHLLKLLARGDIPLRDKAKPKTPFNSRLSLQNKKNCYMIFKLSDKNWQFSSDGDPFSIGREGALLKAYLDPQKVNHVGELIKRDHGGHIDNCPIALFIADGGKAYPAPGSDYSHPFNFHLEILDTDSHGKPSRIPIIIDPDVRYPGGSGED